MKSDSGMSIISGLAQARNYEDTDLVCQEFCAQLGYRYYTFVKIGLNEKIRPPATFFTNEHFGQASIFTTNSYPGYESLLRESNRRITPFFVQHTDTGKEAYRDIGDKRLLRAQPVGLCIPFHIRYESMGFGYYHTPLKKHPPTATHTIQSKLFTTYLNEKLVQLGLQAPRRDMAILNTKESRCLYLLTEGKSYKDIAADIDLSPHTIPYYIKKVIKKLNAKNRYHAIALAITNDHTPAKL